MTISSKPEEYDLIVLGSGAGGKLLAWSMAGKGVKTAVIERRYIGGACPNIACLPSKNVIHSAKIASYFRRSEEFGMTKEGWRVDMAAVRERKRRMVAGLVELHLENFRKSGAEVIMGSGRFVGPRTLEVTPKEGAKRVLRGKRVVIDTGSRATLEDIPGLRASGPLTHVEALELGKIPDHLLVLGGGYVGLELSQAIRRFGSRVTVIERNAHLIHREDPDIREAIHQLFRDEGIQVLTSTRVTRVEGRSGEAVEVRAILGGAESVLEGSHLLVAAGRTPNTEGIGLELAGVETTDRGEVKVDAHLRTTAPETWAVGDCAGSPHFTHISTDDFRVVQDDMQGGSRTTQGRQVPYCIYTDPEFARVGLNEMEAKEHGVPYRLAVLPMESVLRAQSLSETRGFMKALLDTGSDRILGFSAFGPHAGEILAVVQVAMMAGLPFTALRDAVLTHPTMAEGLGELFAVTASLVKGRQK